MKALPSCSTARLLLHCLLTCLLLAWMSSCGNSDEDLACNHDAGAEPLCPEGYSCRIDICIKDHSLAEGDTCNFQIQCAAGLVCPAYHFSCTPRCSSYYQLGEDCVGAVCMPLIDMDGVFLDDGYCTAECTTDLRCSGGKKCLLFTPSIGACFTTCAYTLSADEGYQDNVSHGPQSCHPLEVDGSHHLVAMPSGPGGLGASCSLIEQACEPGLFCLPDSNEELRCHAACDCEEDACLPCDATACIDAGAYRYCSLD